MLAHERPSTTFGATFSPNLYRRAAKQMNETSRELYKQSIQKSNPFPIAQIAEQVHENFPIEIPIQLPNQ